MSVLTTLAFRMVSQEGLEKCLRMHEKINTRDAENISTAAKVEELTKMSKSAKRRLRKKKLKESTQNVSEEDSPSNEIDKNSLDVRAYDLVTLSSKRTAQDFLERTIMASFLLKCLQCVGFFKNPSKQDGKTHFTILTYFTLNTYFKFN